MSIKKTVSIISIWIASFLFGVFYNTNLLCMPYGNMWFRFSRHTLMFVLGAIVFGLLIYGFKDDVEKKIKHKKIIAIIYFLLAGGFLYYLKINNISNNLINGAFVLLIYPLSMLAIYNSIKYKHKYLTMTLIILGMSGMAWLTSGIKLMMFNLILGVIAETVTVLFFNSSNWKKWLLHISGMIFVIIIIFCLIGCNSSDIMYKIEGFLNPKTVYEYNNLISAITDMKWLTYAPDNTFTEDINSMYACTYSHIGVSLGIIPLLIIILTQLIGIVLMWLQSWRFNNRKRKYMGLMCVIIMGLHLIFAISSSFLRIPLVEFGGLFLTSVGLEYCVFPLVFYLYLVYLEIKKPEENNDELESIYDKIIHSNSKFIRFFRELIGADC